jgi:hypothetical protein
MPTVRRGFIAGLSGAAGWPAPWQCATAGEADHRLARPWSEGGGVRQGLAEIGYSVGRDVTVDYPAADHIRERPSARAADLVARSYLPIVFPALLFWEDSRLKILVKLLILRWWSQGESNPRPLECHSSALPTELWPHFARDWGNGVQCGHPRKCREPSSFSSESGQREAFDTSTGVVLATRLFLLLTQGYRDKPGTTPIRDRKPL